jgi:putative hemin transport protein
MNNPHKKFVPARQAAKELGITEAQFVALDAGVLSSRLTLPGDLRAFLAELTPLGSWFIIVRNDNAVLEVPAESLRFEESEGYVNGFVGNAAEKSKIVSHFHIVKGTIVHGFAVRADGMLRRSIQLFDAAGTAVIKFYLLNNDQLDTFDEWVKKHADPDQSPSIHPAPAGI